MYILMTGIIINAITVINSMSCDEDWVEYRGKCYKDYSTKIGWNGAKGTCQLRKAQLATIDSPDTNILVHNNLTKGEDVWIGLDITDITKPNWKWSDGGSTSSYDDWNIYVDSACAIMMYDNSQGYWNTRPCTYMNYYVCEKEQSAENCSDWLSFDTHCYLIITELTVTNMKAARICWEFDAYLISINSQKEADFIYKKLVPNQEYWIGLSPLKWVSGVPYQWNNWGESGPALNTTNGCVYMNATSGKWSHGHCGSSLSPHTFRPYICQRDAVIDISTTPNAAIEVNTHTDRVYSESNTTEFDSHNLSTIPNSSETSKQLLLTIIVPAVCGGLVAIIVIIVIVILIQRKKRSNGYNKRNQPPMNTTYVTNDKAVRGSGNEDKGEHRGQENYIYDEAEVVQADNGTVLVNGDVYAIVDRDRIQNPKVQDDMVSQQHTKNNRKQEIAKGQNHIIIGADVYAIVNKNSVKPDSRQKPKQKKKKPPTPPKLEDKSGEINSNGLSHVVVGTDVYAVVDKEKVKPNKQQTTQQKKKKPPTPPKLEDKTEDINTNGQVHKAVGTDVYAVVDKEKVKPNKEQTTQQKKKKPPTPPKLEDKTDDINTNGQSHVAVGTDVYAVVDKEKVKPNKQQKPQQKKKKPPAPPKLVDKAGVMHEGSVYYESDIDGIPAISTKHKTEVKKKTEDTGVVYADLDLTGSGTSNHQAGNHYEESGVVYADVRG